MELKDHQERLDHKDHQDYRAFPGQQELLELLVPQEPREIREPRGDQEHVGLQVEPEIKDQLVQRETLDLLDPWVFLDHKDKLDQLEHQDSWRARTCWTTW